MSKLQEAHSGLRAPRQFFVSVTGFPKMSNDQVPSELKMFLMLTENLRKRYGSVAGGVAQDLFHVDPGQAKSADPGRWEGTLVGVQKRSLF